MTPLLLLLAAAPADLAPGAGELEAARKRYDEVYAVAEATGVAVAQLQTTWALGAVPKSPCGDLDRLSLGWRLERFGAAWREAVQALRTRSEELRVLRAAPTVSPLLLGAAGVQLDEKLARADALVGRFLQTSAWQVAYVRPTLAACPITGEGLSPGVANLPLAARGEGEGLVAVVGRGDGFVCPGPIRGDDAVVLVAGGSACWAPDATCGCEPAPVFPGAVLGPPIVEGTEPAR
jgi:hypothetical protein